MSHPDESVPLPGPIATPDAAPPEAPAAPAPPMPAMPMPATPMPADTAAAAASTHELPIPSGGPYRVPAPPPEPPPPELHFGPAPRQPRPLIGPALSVFAVLLWTFVVAGQFASSWMLGAQIRSGEASIIVLLTTFVAWVASLRRSRIAVPPRQMTNFIWRGIGIGVLAVVFFLVCIVAATFAGYELNHDLLVAFVLVLVSLLAAIAGAKLTSPTPPERTPRQRFVLVALWVAGTLLTLVAGVDLAANG